MSTPSNMYAEKVFAEHPVAMWSFDDQADFISLYSNNMSSNWTGVTWTTTTDTTVPVKTATSVYTTSNISTTTTIVNTTNAISTSKPFSIAFYCKVSDTTKITGIRIGYRIGTGGANTFISTPNAPRQKVSSTNWVLFSETFYGVTGNNIYPVIEITANASANISINNFTVGCWSEEFSGVSTGITASQTTLASITTRNGLTGISTSATKGIVCSGYGLSAPDAYYITSGTYNEFLNARETALPMTYGKQNSLALYPTGSNTVPSIIFPAFGFMNESGKYKKLSFEAWIKLHVDTYTKTPFRFFGPINSSSTDGLYSYDQSIILKIGNSFASHYVGEWSRPILLNLNVGPDLAELFINGEKVISLTFSTATSFLSIKDGSNKDNDWVGFFVDSSNPSSLTSIELDCVAIYPYHVSETIAKRRYVYAQGILQKPLVSPIYYSKTITTDYSVSNYANNYRYPNSGSWAQGIKENVSFRNNKLNTPEVPDPTFVSENPTLSISDFLSDNASNAGQATPYFSIVPTSSYTSYNNVVLNQTISVATYLEFEKVQLLEDKVFGIYGVFSQASNPSSRETLMKIKNVSTGDYLRIAKNASSSTIAYYFKYGSSSEVQIATMSTTNGSRFTVGVDFVTLMNSSIYGMIDFLGNPDLLRLQIGSDDISSTTFSGSVFSIGFMTKKNLSTFKTTYSSAFNSDGVITTEVDSNTFSASAKMKINKQFGITFFDYSVNSYWEDHVPLSVLAKNIIDQNGDTVPGLDYVQFNIDNYEPQGFVTNSPSVKTYVSFQTLSSGANATSGFTNVALTAKGMVDARTIDSSKKYEVVNGSIIYVPNTIDISQYAIVVHIEMINDSIKTNSSSIRYLELASQALNYSGTNPIQTKDSTPIYPYSSSDGNAYDYKQINPISIYKDVSTYLYKTSKSGLCVLDMPATEPSGGRGYYFDIPPTKSYLTSLEVPIKISKSIFTSSLVSDTTEMKVFEIKGISSISGATTSSAKEIHFFVKKVNSNSSTDNRVTMYYKLYKDGSYITGETVYIDFYINGSYVNNPMINMNEWTIVGIFMKNFISLENNAKLRIVGKNANFDNISIFSLNKDNVVDTSVTINNWSAFNSPSIYWNTSPQFSAQWSSVQTTVTSGAASMVNPITPTLTYNIYTGTQKIIVDSDVTLNKFKLSGYEYNIYKDVSSTYLILTPV